MELQPGLAKDWEFVDDGNAMILYLEEGVSFHDGTPFNAEAVKFNLERYINPTGIVIWDLTDALASVEVMDEYTVRLNFTEPNINMIYNLAQDPGFMISPTALQEEGEEWISQHPVGTGPYVFESWEPGTEVVMVRNENYWREGLPMLDQINWKILVDNSVRSISLTTGEIDIETFVPPKDVAALEKDENVNLWVQPGGLAMVTFNHTEPPFNVKENREAVRYAIDYGAIGDIIYYGLSDEPTGGPFPTGMWPYDPSRPKLTRDLDKARELLAAAGNPDGFSVDIVYEPDDIGQQLAEAVQASLSEVGINVNLIKTDFARFIEILQTDRKAVQMLIFTYGRMRVSAEEFFLNDWMCDGSNAFADWCNAELDETVLQSMRTFDYDERLALLRHAEDIFIEDVAGVPLAYPPFIHATDNRVLGYSVHPVGLLNFRWLSLAE
jgi:peptide/nickel transport system substrate-binding protein